MALLDEKLVPTSLRIAKREEVLKELRTRFWIWFWENQYDVVLSRRVLLWKVDIRLHDLRPIFEKIIGRDDFMGDVG